MIDLNKKKPDGNSISFSKIIMKSTILAMIFAIPSLGIFLVIYYNTGDLLIAALVGFGIHFVVLAFSGRISKLIAKTIP